jgi:hypothetical protein
MSAGAFGGLVLAPMGFAPDSHQGLAFVPSMGLGVLLAGPAVTGVLVWADGTAPALNAAAAALPGVLAGSVWNIGNAASILAVGDPSVGLALAYPIMQCGLAVAGLWGVLLFKEITGALPVDSHHRISKMKIYIHVIALASFPQRRPRAHT